jgi:hypothetical protein
MSEAETRAELIETALTAARWGVVDASRVRCGLITLVGQQRASKPSGHIHAPAAIGYPPRNIARLIEDVGDDRRRPGCPSKPIAMQLDPAKPIPRQLWIGPWMCQPGTRFGCNPHQRRVVCLNQPPGGIRPRGPMRRGLKITSDHAQILLPGGVRDQDWQCRSCRRRARPTLGASTDFLKFFQHTPCLALQGTGIANTASREIAHAGIQAIGQCPWYLAADLFIHASGHPKYLVSARYHIQGPVRNNRSTQRTNQRTASPTSPAIAAIPA